MASIAPAAPQPRLRRNSLPSLPRCLSTFGLYGSSCSAALASSDPSALMAPLLVSLWPIRSQLHCSVQLGLILRPSRPHCLSAFGLYGLRCTAAFGFGLIQRPLWPHCLSAFGLYGSSCSAASAKADPMAIVASLLVSLRPIRPSCTAAFGFDLILRPSWPRSLSAFGFFCSSCSAPSAKANPTAVVASLLVSLRLLWLQLPGSSA